MGGFDVELAALPTAKAETDRVHGQLQSALGDVSGKVTALLGSGWSGPAATSYQQAFDEWHTGAEDVLKALTAMSQLLTVTEQAYEGSDTASSDMLTKLAGRLS